MSYSRRAAARKSAAAVASPGMMSGGAVSAAGAAFGCEAGSSGERFPGPCARAKWGAAVAADGFFGAAWRAAAAASGAAASALPPVELALCALTEL